VAEDRDAAATRRAVLYNGPRLRVIMADHNLRALIGTTPENVGYLADHVGWAQQSYRDVESFAILSFEPSESVDVVLTRQDNTYYATFGGTGGHVESYGGAPALRLPDDTAALTEEEIRYLALHQSGGRNRSGAEAVAAALSNRGITSGRIGVDTGGCSAATLAALRELLPGCELLPAGEAFLMARLVKTTAELGRMRDALLLNEVAVDAALANARPGVPEREIAATWRAEVARGGASWQWFHFGSGRRSAFIFPPSGKTLAAGEVIVIDAGLRLGNYFSDTGLCVVIGEPSSGIRKDWEIVLQAFADGLERIREGVTAPEIFDVIVAGMRARGWDDFAPPHVGHTIGIEPREFPYTLGPARFYSNPFLPGTSAIPLPAGSVINVEIPVGELGKGGYQIEKTLVVTPAGYEELAPQGRDIRILDA
jgi:Xaa-Pro dipeptidase